MRSIIPPALKTPLVALLMLTTGVWNHLEREFPTLERVGNIMIWGLTLKSLGAALVVIYIGFWASRVVPMLLERWFLRRLQVAVGARFATLTIARYAMLLGMVIAGSACLGFQWSSVQWLAAAISVGLGFGLQEIISNFVSGLILLFEQPMRIGDIVTVGDIEGKVTRIQMRSTTILDWDNRELVVPNKEFITGRLINWTLTDTSSRLKILVGVAYGSDTALVEKTLMDVALAQPKLLKEPPPSVVFLAFGDSALQFELRVFITHRNDYAVVLHEMNMAIDQAFRKAGIEIAFPQLDLHVRHLPGEGLKA
ncbi:MAG: mechanosensitive ion channel family protein [Planctomycetota bacterium]